MVAGLPFDKLLVLDDLCSTDFAMAAFDSYETTLSGLLDPLYVELVHLRYRWDAADLPPRTPVAARALIDIILLGPNCGALDHVDIPNVTFATPVHTERRARAYPALHLATPDPHSPFNTPADLARTLHLDVSEEPDAS